MRIISKFRDYYDHIQRYGQDMNVVYSRLGDQEVFSMFDTYDRDKFVIYFCGKSYPCVRYCIRRYSSEREENYWVTKFCYSLKEYEDFSGWRGVRQNRDIDNFFRAFSTYNGENETYSSPVVIRQFREFHGLGNSTFRQDFSLKLLDFERIVSDKQAFSSIASWISREKEVNLPVVKNDKIRLVKRGFDPKISFRHRKN